MKKSCDTCKHNHNIEHADNFHSYCPKGNCVYCVQVKGIECKDHEEGIAVEIDEDE